MNDKAKILIQHQQLRATCFNIAVLMDATSAGIIQYLGNFMIGTDDMMERREKRLYQDPADIPLLDSFFKLLPQSIYLFVFVFSKIYSRYFWIDIETQKIYKLLTENSHYLIEDSEKFSNVSRELQSFENYLRTTRSFLFTASVANDFFDVGINMVQYAPRTSINILYTGFYYSENALSFMTGNNRNSTPALLDDFKKQYQNIFDIKGEVKISQPYLCSKSSSRFNTQLCFVLECEVKYSQFNSAKKQAFITRAFCPESITHIDGNYLCMTIELPFNYYTGNLSLTSLQLKEKLIQARDQVGMLLKRLNTLGNLPPSFIAPEDHQDDYRLIIITDPRYYFEEDDRFNFVSQRINDATINLMDLTKEQLEILKNKINPNVNQPKPVQQKLPAASSQGKELYTSNYFAPLFSSTRNKKSSARNLLGFDFKRGPNLDALTIEEKPPQWENAQYNQENEQFQIICLEKRVANQVVDSHVYVRIPINHYPQFEKFTHLCTQDLDKHNGFKLFYANGKNTGCFKTHEHSDERYLAYAKTWGWQETIINGKSKQKRVLLVEVDVTKSYTHAQLDRVTQLTQEMMSSLAIYEDGDGYEHAVRLK